MTKYHLKISFIITVIFMAVILLVIGIFNFSKHNNLLIVQNTDKNIESDNIFRHVLNGNILEVEDDNFFTTSIMFDNAYDARPQYGLDKADIIYEALAEGSITRLMGVFDSRQNVDKIGPVRSARPYFMDFANDYKGVYMHVGGSPDALDSIDNYNFHEIDQIGAGEIYFWRDNNLDAPHNVFTSSSNWLRVGEINSISNINLEKNWNFVDFNETGSIISDFVINYNGVYKVDWKFNNKLKTYLRWQGDNKFFYHTGEQVRADNVVVKVIETKVVDNKLRREMDTKSGGKAFIFNKLGKQEGTWEIVDGCTVFFDANENELEFLAGKTWVQVIPDEDMLIIK